jgi:hypothetical protein
MTIVLSSYHFNQGEILAGEFTKQIMALNLSVCPSKNGNVDYQAYSLSLKIFRLKSDDFQQI